MRVGIVEGKPVYNDCTCGVSKLRICLLPDFFSTPTQTDRIDAGSYHPWRMHAGAEEARSAQSTDKVGCKCAPFDLWDIMQCKGEGATH